MLSALSVQLTDAEDALSKHPPPPSDKPADSEARAGAIKATAAEVVLIADGLTNAEDEFRQAQVILRAAGRPGAGEGVDRLVTAFTRLGPIDYLGHWINRRSRRYGAGVTVTMIASLTILFFVIALALMHALNGRMVVFVAVVGGVSVAVALVLWLLSRKWSSLDPLRSAVVLLTPVLMALAAFWSAVSWYAVAVPVLTALIVWLALGAMHRWNSPPRVAWILFATIAFWSGALAFIGERWARYSTLDVALVRQKSPAPTVAGLYIGRSGTAVYLASLNTCHERGCRRVMSIPDKQVTCVVSAHRCTSTTVASRT